jgi:hypothetical protein
VIGHGLIVLVQALIAFGVLSFALRPPGTRQRRAAAAAAAIPTALSDDLTPPDGIVVPAVLTGRPDSGGGSAGEGGPVDHPHATAPSTDSPPARAVDMPDEATMDEASGAGVHPEAGSPEADR